MDNEEKDELHRIWAKYLDTASSKEADLWLDMFLSKFIQAACQEESYEKVKELSWGWRNASNTLAHQLIFKMYQICNDMATLVPSEALDTLSSVPLQEYLLNGQGWKLLWTLEMMGLKNLTCTKGLVNLLIAHMPVALTFSVSESNVPDWISSKYPGARTEVSALTSNENISISSSTHSLKKHHTLNASKILLRQRIAKEKVKSATSDGSSSDNETYIIPKLSAFSLSQRKVLQKNDNQHVEPLKASPDFLLESCENEIQTLLDFSTTEEFRTFQNLSLSVVSYIKYVLYLLEKIAVNEQKNWMASMSSSQSIATFAIKSLTDLFDSHCEMEGWMKSDIKKLRNQFLKLIIQSTVGVKGAKGLPAEIDLVEVLKIFLTALSSMVTEDDSIETCSLDIQFMYDALLGILSYLRYFVQECSTDLTQVISTVRTFSSCDGIRIFCSAVAEVEKASDSDHQIAHVFSQMKIFILLLKELRMQNTHSAINSRDSHRHDNLHHHSDVLGSMFSHSIGLTEPMCCVATMCHLMLKLYTTSSSNTTKKFVLRIILDAGLCCCTDPSFVISSLFRNFERHGIDHQQLILIVLEKAVFPQLGLAPLEALTCLLCLERQSECQNVNISANPAINSSNSVQVNFNDSSKWQCLNVYCELLDLKNNQSITLVKKHMNFVFRMASTYIKKEVFTRAVFPHLMKLVFELRKGNALSSQDNNRMICFLSLLPCLLFNDSIASMFIQFGGIRILCDIMGFTQFCSMSLKSMKVLIVMEIKAHKENSDLSLLYIPETSFTGLSSMVTFIGILSKYSHLFLNDINKKRKDTPEQVETVKKFKLAPPFVEKSFYSSLIFLCDLWSVCKDIVIKIPISSSYINNNTMINSYDLFVALLKNLKRFSEFKDPEMFQHYLLLVKYLLIVILHYEFITRNLMQGFPSREQILMTIKSSVSSDVLIESSNLEALLTTLMLCSFGNFEDPENSFSSLEKDYSGLSTSSSSLDELTSSSDKSDVDNEALNSSYDGDAEKSDSEDFNPSCSVAYLSNYQNIRHGDLIKLVLEIVVHFANKNESDQQVTVRMLHLIHSFCKNSDANKAVLCKQGICSNLLGGFSRVLSSSTNQYEDLQKAILNLFALLSQHSIMPDDLRQFISLCKPSAAPFKLLVETLKTVVDMTPISPYHSVTFPCAMNENLKIGKHELAKYNVLLKSYYKYSRHKPIIFNAWSSAASVIPLPLDNKWSLLRKEFSFMSWLTLEESGQLGQENSFSYEEESNFDEKDFCHLLSLGSDAYLLELWINKKKGDLIFRMNAYHDGGIYRLANATCKNFLKHNVWQHLTVDFKEIREKKKVMCTIHVLLDGCMQETVLLSFSDTFSKKEQAYFVLMGQAVFAKDGTQTGKTLSLSNMMIFKGETITRDIAFYVANLGPTVANVLKCVLGGRNVFLPSKVHPKVLGYGLDAGMLSGLSIPSLKILQKNILLFYSAEKPNTCALYPQPTRMVFPLLAPFSSAGNFNVINQNDWPSQQEPEMIKLVHMSHPLHVQHKSVYSSMHHIGGISTILFLFARVIECSQDEETQASALELLLKMISRDCQSADYFLKIGGDHILKLLLICKKCVLSPFLLKVLFDNCLSGEIFLFTPWINEWKVDTKTEVIISKPLFWILLIKTVFNCESRNDQMQVHVIQAVTAFLRDDHPHSKFNIQQMKAVQMLETLLCILKDYYILADQKLSVEVAKGIPCIIEKMLSKPIDFREIWLICDFLLLMHRTSHTYVCHANSSFYFLLTQHVPSLLIKKEKASDAFSEGTASSTGSTKTLDIISPALKKRKPLRNVKSMTDLDLSERHNLKMSLEHRDMKDNKTRSQLMLDFGKTTNPVELELNDSGVVTNPFITGMDSSTSLKDDFIDEDSTEPKLPEDKGTNAEIDLDKTEIYLGLLNLVHDIILHSDKAVKSLVLDVVRPEVFIVLAYNTNARIAHAAIEILHAYLQSASEEKIIDFLDIKGFHLVANQLHQMPADPLITSAFFNLMFFGTHVAEDPLRCNLTRNVANSLQIMSTIPLLSLLPNTSTNLGVCNSVLSAINNLITEVPNSISELTNNGFCESFVQLIFRIHHFHDLAVSNSETENTEKNIVTSSIFFTLRTISSSLFSSKDTSDFDAYTSLLHMFCNFEIQCYFQCDGSSPCVSCWRDCQCVVFQAALDFVQLYNYTQLKEDFRSDLDDATLWEVLIASMPDNLNPYSSFIDTSSDDVTCGKVEPNISDSQCVIQDVERATKELPMTDASDRFKFLMDKASDFLVFRDISRSGISAKEKGLFRSLYHSLVRGISTFKEISGGNKKTRWTAVVFPAKDSLRQQLYRLLISTLALDNIEQKMFTLELLAKESNSAEVMSVVFFNAAKMEPFHMFLSSISDEILSWHHQNIYKTVCSQLMQIMEKASVNASFDPDSVNMFIKEWKQQWFEAQRLWLQEQVSTPRKMQKKLDKLAKQISGIAMDVTKKVVDLQSIERKKFMEEVKLTNTEEVSTRDIWRSLIEQLTHERAVWYMKDCYPSSWESDPTEGPQRIRKRLRRCHLDVNAKFVQPDYIGNIGVKDMPFCDLIGHRLPDSSLVINKLHANEKIEYACPCKIVMTFEEAKGEILIGDHFLHFIGEETRNKEKIISERWSFYFIKEILLRRFELQNNAFEIFMKNGLTYLVAFLCTKDLENVWKRLESLKLPCVTEINSSSLAQLWRDQTITNFDYLTQLNKLAGRSFNDLMQYPVFPFILADYTSSILNLNDSTSFRNLAKPIAIQNKSREEHYIKAYNSLKNELITGPWSCSEVPISGPYHYGSHYSNSGTVLHYLVRLLPYTYSLIHYQDNSFDIPDRTFHSVDTSWQLVTKNSTSDVKELIPEFFFLPEFLCNKNGFDLGIRQCGTRVNDVILPVWCKNDPRLYVLIHRQALESAHVTNSLHNWIDLVFGYKQTGVAAVNAINVFPPATYYGMDISKLEDPITRNALKAMIKTVGQMPRQLFVNPHSMVSLALAPNLEEENQRQDIAVLDTVFGLRWGNYVGSPSTAKPNLIWRCKQSIPVGSLLSIFTNDVFGLQQNVCLLLNHSRDKSPSISTATYIRSAALISWAHDDGIVRIKFCRDHPPVPLINGNSVDPICLCASVPDCNELFIAHTSGTIFVYNCDVDSSKFVMTENRLPIQLSGHSAAITCICICKSFSIVVTASEDKTCIIWDLNRLCYVRSITGHESAVKLVCVSDTLGDIASVSSRHSGEGSCLKVHTINGDEVGSIDTPEIVTALCYSTAPEGISVNVIATGTASGLISLWSSWDLKLVREIREEKFKRPITCMTFSLDNEYLYAANVDGTVAVWEKPSKMLMSMPRFLLFT